MLSADVNRYISLRRALGYKLVRAERHLLAFARFAAEHDESHIRTATALAWLPVAAKSPNAMAHRLTALIIFARFMQAEDALVAQITEKLGGIDVLVNVAGGFTWETLADGSLESWHKMFAMNVMTAATITRASLDTLKASPAGRIVNIGAGGAIKADMA